MQSIRKLLVSKDIMGYLIRLGLKRVGMFPPVQFRRQWAHRVHRNYGVLISETVEKLAVDNFF